MTSKRNHSRLYKVIVLGEGNVGKTSIIKRWGKRITSEEVLNITTTTGIDSITKEIIIDGIAMKLSVWDPAGQEKMRSSVVPLLYRDAKAAIFVYDISNKASFDNIKLWFNESKKNGVDISEIPCIVLANKCDLKDVAVSEDTGKEFANSLGMMFCQTSALLDTEQENLNNAFLQLGHMLKYSKRELKPEQKTVNLNATENVVKESGGCSGWCSIL